MDENSRTFLQQKSTGDVLLGLIVYKLCTYQWLVEAAPHLIAFSEKIGLEKVVYWIIKKTFFQHFCGGETPEECLEVMERLSAIGMNAILDLSVEADEDTGTMSFERLEENADFILSKTKHSLETAAKGARAGAFAAVKVTALAPPELLLRLNQTISALSKAFHKYQNNGKIDGQSFRKIVDEILPQPATETQRRQRDAILSRIDLLDFIEYTKLLNLHSPDRDLWWTGNDFAGSGALMAKRDLEAYDRLIGRMDEICSMAKRLGAGVMIDAEQSYFQEAIDHVALNMQAKYNQRIPEEEHQTPTVYNTYQMYTKAALSKLEVDVERAHRENFAFAAKLVRGAYMVSERKRALENHYPSPIQDTIQDTHASYNQGVKFLLTKLHEHQVHTGEALTASTAPIVFMVATHNRESVILTIQEMERQGVLPRSGVVHFGQLFAMKDQLSTALARNGYSIYKYLPYGHIQDVIPYLIRRAQENSAVLGDVGHERALMAIEIKDRLLGSKRSVVITSASHTETAPSVANGATSVSTDPSSGAADMSAGVAETA
ncbi:FAD-linked oxidoreductase-like protein [Dichotomocladium elegans]|nr:FAD-linked oxidoreductase-like protein [Dichotomocladium elegans]